jgi:5-bromo-4-chloroindolyl phosphate hydrolysis protein
MIDTLFFLAQFKSFLYAGIICGCFYKIMLNYATDKAI